MGCKLMQISGEGINDFLLNTVLEKKKIQKDVDVKTHLSMLFYLGMGKKNTGYIKSYGNLIIILHKLISMNHCHLFKCLINLNYFIHPPPPHLHGHENAHFKCAFSCPCYVMSSNLKWT
jgi:hypothetical protein